MKTILTCILVFLVQMSSVSALPPKKPLPNPDEWLKDQKDQTDTLAIPLDNSEEEERQEELELQKKQRTTPRK